MRKVAPVAMPRGTISFWCGQVYSSRGGQFLGSAEAGRRIGRRPDGDLEFDRAGPNGNVSYAANRGVTRDGDESPGASPGTIVGVHAATGNPGAVHLRTLSRRRKKLKFLTEHPVGLN